MKTTTLSLILLLAVGCRERGVDTDIAPIDADGDGVAADVDCNDEDPSAFPDAPELCDGIDNDCDELIDDAATDAETFYRDGDGDGYGDAADAVAACDAPVGYVTDSTDCDDAASAYHPGADESDCTDPADYNCDGSVGYADADADGFAACEECDDGAADINPLVDETCDDVDNDCDGAIDEEGALGTGTWYADADGDGFGDAQAAESGCDQPEGYVDDNSDCDDTSDEALPGGTERCDSVDNDCDGDIDEPDATDATTWYGDNDGDGHGASGTSVVSCDAPDGFVTTALDCDDEEASTNPDAAEVCDEADNDCDGDVDEDFAPVWYVDVDGDGFGTDALTSDDCEAPAGFVDVAGDCDDGEAAVNPDATEVCNGIEDACAGLPADEADGDGDDVRPCDGDCDDADPDAYPGNDEVWYDGIDGDCDGGSDLDQDGDGHDSAVHGGDDCNDLEPLQFDSCIAGTGLDGDLDVPGPDTVVNVFVELAAPATTGEDTLQVSDGSAFASGDEVLIIESVGTHAGTYEFALVNGVAGDELSLSAGLSGTYGSDSAHATQVIAVPHYETVAVANGGSIVAPAWNGSTGGIVVFRASGGVTLDGVIDASGRGYRGVERTDDPNQPGDQGEGTLGVGILDRAPNTNGGGGGERNGCECCWGGAGAGGGHGTIGSDGSNGGNACQLGGQGGDPVGQPAQTELFFGGAGGQGGADEDGWGSGAGNGGGIVYIGTTTLSATATGGILALGAAGPAEVNFSGCGSGGGGGGAGGAIYLVADTVDLNGSVHALGGPGGNSPSNCGTAGGAGGDGRITIDADSVVGTTQPAAHEL